MTCTQSQAVVCGCLILRLLDNKDKQSGRRSGDSLRALPPVRQCWDPTQASTAAIASPENGGAF